MLFIRLTFSHTCRIQNASHSYESFPFSRGITFDLPQRKRLPENLSEIYGRKSEQMVVLNGRQARNTAESML